MAEAHAAVAFRFEVSHEGVYFDYNQELLHNIYASVIRGYKRQVAKLKNRFRAEIYPLSPLTLPIWTVVMFAILLLRWDEMYLTAHRDFFGYRLPGVLLASAVLGTLTWWALVLLIRLFIKLLLSYKGWMYERIGKASLSTKIWALTVKTVLKNPHLYSVQSAMPKLPLPNLDSTIARWLHSVRPLYDDEKYHRMEKLSQDFVKGIGPKLQRYLLLKSWFSSNYVSDWWEEYIYLRGRSPIMVNSNYYGLDTIFLHPTKIQAARAATLTYAALRFRCGINRQELKPIMALNIYPLCSAQYERMFNTTRIPGIETDKLVHWDSSYHVAVFFKGCWYKCPIHNGKRLLFPAELEYNYQQILDSKEQPCRGEEYLGALTGTDRTTWARARTEYFKSPTNRASLDIIEKAAFVVALDEDEVTYDPNDSSQLDRWAHKMLHGRGYDRWFDKSFNIIITRNGRCGINAEHAWADAPVIGQLAENGAALHFIQDEYRGDAPAMAYQFENNLCVESVVLGYTEEGHTKGALEPDNMPPAPSKLKWEFSDEAVAVIDEAKASTEAVYKDVEMRLLVFTEYGKGFMKKCHLSPDGYIQMALQLAYYRDQGKFGLTYEASMTRLFREGRTETVRSATNESCAFVLAMENPKSTNTERIELLNNACRNHQNLYRDAMCGKGVDRHLFCLYVVSKYLEIESPFLKEILSEPWHLSTSQTPHQQTDVLDLNKHPNYISAGGGFGPVADDGYGVSYVIGGENVVSFHISSKLSCPTTSSARFREGLRRALFDMREMFKAAEGETASSKPLTNGCVGGGCGEETKKEQ